MVHHEDLKGCTAVVREPDTLEVLLKTVVLEYNREKALVTIRDDKKQLRRLDKVSIIILGQGKAYEYLGSTRRLMASDSIDLALYNCKTTPIRAEKRYHLNSEAVVEAIPEKLSKTIRKLPFKIYVLNISASGALVDPVHQCFEVGEVFVMRMKIGGTEVTITAEVLREEHDSHQNRRYGCRFLSVK